MAKVKKLTGFTLNELYELCKKGVEAGYGDRIVMKPGYHLGNTHQDMRGELTPLEKVTRPVSLDKKYRVQCIEIY